MDENDATKSNLICEFEGQSAITPVTLYTPVSLPTLTNLPIGSSLPKYFFAEVFVNMISLGSESAVLRFPSSRLKLNRSKNDGSAYNTWGSLKNLSLYSIGMLFACIRTA